MLCHASGFEDIYYWVQLTGLNKQKTGPNSGGIYYMYILQIFIKIADFVVFFTFFTFSRYFGGGGEGGEGVVFFQVAHVDRKLLF